MKFKPSIGMLQTWGTKSMQYIGPLIRRESIYSNLKIKERRKIFSALFHFARRSNFKYLCISIDKKYCLDRIDLIQKISKGLSAEVGRKDGIFKSFNHFIVYYDNGQVKLTKIITSVFSSLLDSVEFRKINTVEYKFSQVADLACTLELMNLKLWKGLTKSEKEFFKSERDLKKNIFKYINRKRV